MLFNIFIFGSLVYLIYILKIIPNKIINYNNNNNNNNNLEISDKILETQIIKSINRYLIFNPKWALRIIYILEYIINISICYILFYSFYTNNFIYLIKLIYGSAIYLLCEYINIIPAPKNKIWIDSNLYSYFFNYIYVALIIANIFLNNFHFIYFFIFFLIFILELGLTIVLNKYYFLDIYFAVSTFGLINFLISQP